MVSGSVKVPQPCNILAKAGVILILLLNLSFGQLVDRVVANVNGEPILESEVKIASLFYGIKDREKVIKLLVEKHLIAQFLRENGLSVPESYVDSVIKDIAKSNGKTVEEFYRDLYREGLTPKDLKDFLKVEFASTFGLREYLKGKVEVSEVEIELERLKKGEIKFLREIKLLVIDKGRREDILKAMEGDKIDIDGIAKTLGLKTETLRVSRGDLVEPLDREVWKVRPGQLAIAEDDKNLYIAEMLRVIRVISGRSEEEIKRDIVRRKMKELERELTSKLKKNSFVEIYG